MRGPVPAALVLLFAISALAQVSADAVTTAAAASGGNSNQAVQPSSVNVAAAAAAAAVTPAATTTSTSGQAVAAAPSADISVDSKDGTGGDGKAPTFLGKLLQELEQDNSAAKPPATSQQADKQPAATGSSGAPETAVGGLMSLPGAYDDPSSYVYKRINTPTKPTAREGPRSRAAESQDKERHTSHSGDSEGRTPEPSSRGSDEDRPKGTTDSSSKAELKWLGGSKASTSRLSSDGTVRSKRVYSVTEYTVPQNPSSSYSSSQPQRSSMQPGNRPYQPYQTTYQQPGPGRQYQQYSSGQYTTQQGQYGPKSPYSYTSPRLPLPRSQQQEYYTGGGGGPAYTGGPAYRGRGGGYAAAPMPNPGAPKRSRYTPYTPESAWDTYQDASGSYGQVDYGYGVGYDDSLYGTGYDEPLSGGASYQQPSSHSPYDNDQFSSSDSYGSSGYDSGYGSGPEFGDSSMFDSLGGSDDLDDPYDFEAFSHIQERNYRDNEGYDRWGFDEQGYNRDGLSRQEIISLLRMVLRAEDDRSSSRGGGGRGYDGADAELYGRKVQKGKAQAMRYLKSYLESFSSVRPRTTATSGTRAATKSAPASGHMSLGLKPQQPAAATMRAPAGSDRQRGEVMRSRGEPQGEVGINMRARPREVEEEREGPRRSSSSRPRDPWDPKDRE